jgi:branched-chain amino acid transport system substrate-binding protein
VIDLRQSWLWVVVLWALWTVLPVHPQTATDSLKIGVLIDQSGPHAETSGKGSLLAAQLAVDEVGPMVRGRHVEILSADHHNKPDIAATIAQRWFDLDKVAAIVDLPGTPAALAVQSLAREKSRTTLITAAPSSDITAENCTLVSTHWADDTHALTVGAVRALVERGNRSWFFITVDSPLGHELQSQATPVIDAIGGKVLGTSKFPSGAPDFSPALLQAKSSGADAIVLASEGEDLRRLLKQANELGFSDGKPTINGTLVYITDVHALGLEVAQNLTFGAGFYWDQSDASRAFASRFVAETGSVPTKNHAAVYTAVRHYLRAVDHAGSDDAITVNKVMRQLPVDYFGRPATVRADGRVIYDLTLYRVKTPAESKYAWDYYVPIKTIAKEDAFLPMNAACGP